jgi:hypothetical protein
MFTSIFLEIVKLFNYSPVKLYNKQKSVSIQNKLGDSASILRTFKEKLRNKHNTRFRLEYLASWGEFRNAKGESLDEKMDNYCR